MTDLIYQVILFPSLLILLFAVFVIFIASLQSLNKNVCSLTDILFLPKFIVSTLMFGKECSLDVCLFMSLLCFFKFATCEWYAVHTGTHSFWWSLEILLLFSFFLSFFFFRPQRTILRTNRKCGDGISLNSALANMYMKIFEIEFLIPQSLKCSLRYIDNFIIWSHRSNTVTEFLEHINGILPETTFTMMWKRN